MWNGTILSSIHFRCRYGGFRNRSYNLFIVTFYTVSYTHLRCAVTMAGRVSELSHTADSVQKPSVLGKLKQAQERLSHEAKNWKHTAKKKEQQL